MLVGLIAAFWTFILLQPELHAAPAVPYYLFSNDYNLFAFIKMVIQPHICVLIADFRCLLYSHSLYLDLFWMET